MVRWTGVGTGFLLTIGLSVSANAAVIYDSLTGGRQQFSQGYACCQIVELGDQITFARNERILTTVTVNMDQFPLATPTPYTEPLTLNLYNSNGAAAGSLFASRTVNFNITPDATSQTHFDVSFDFSGVVVPDTIFYGLAFDPTGEASSLNFTVWNESTPFGTPDGPIPVGTDVTNIVYSRHTSSDPFVDDGAGNGDANDLDKGFTPAIQFNAVPEPASMALLGSALLGFAGIGYRRRRRKA